MQRITNMFRGLVGNRRLLAVFLVLAASSVLFMIAASEVMEGETLAFDRWILLAMRSPGNPAIPIGPIWLRSAMTDITALGGYTTIIIINLAAIGYLLAVRRRGLAIYIAGAVLSGLAGSTLLKLDYLRPRPELVARLVEVHTSSFPSGHAMNAAITYLTLGSLLAGTERNRLVRLYVMSVAIFLTVAIGISRVYLGVHWPSDVLVGWSLGGVWAFLCAAVFAELQRRHKLGFRSE